jgi:HSP20 family protein
MFRSLIPRRERSVMPFSGRFGSLSRMEDEMEELLGRWFGGDGGPLAVGGFIPSLDLTETEGSYVVKVDLPGVKPEEVEVELKGRDLWIHGKREEQKEEEGKTFHRIERQYGEFRRVITLPVPINEEGIEAKFGDGVLQITVPKTEEAKAKHIQVTA